MESVYFIVRVPDESGALHKAVDIAKKYHANIHRIHYNKRIDPNTVFFDITTSKYYYENIKADLEGMGYLETFLHPVSYLKFNVYLPHRAGALFQFLGYLTSSGANIGFMDFDDKSINPGKLVVSLTLEDSSLVNNLLNELKSVYRLEILDYNEEYDDLDDTIFYIVFAQRLRSLIGPGADDFLMKLLNDINHIVQELTRRGEEPRKVFESVLLTGRTLMESVNKGFYADVQRIKVKDNVILYCFQPPCGGNIYVLNTPEEMMMIDTGYGIYYTDVQAMLQYYGLGDLSRLERIIITHADADHCGAGGLYDTKNIMHRDSAEVIRKANRAYGSVSENLILEEAYTTLINLFSKFQPSENIESLQNQDYGKRGIFPVMNKFSIGGLEFEVLESLGGHLNGQIYLLCPDMGIIFTSDALINFTGLSEDRRKYNLLAKTLMTSVNVDHQIASRERLALIQLIKELNTGLMDQGKSCLVCAGHGTISRLIMDKLETYGEIEHYKTSK